MAVAGTTSVNTLLLSANDIDDAVLLNNRVTYRTTVDQAGLLVLTAGVPTNLLVQGNFIYRKNTTTANGSLVAIGGTVANATGFIIGNYVQTLTTTADKLTPPPPASPSSENRVSGVGQRNQLRHPAPTLRGSIPRPWKGSRRKAEAHAPASLCQPCFT